MGDIVSFGDSLMITVFSMVVVFVVLIAISYLIELLRVATNGNKDKKEIASTNIVVEEKTSVKKEDIKVEEKLDDEELVAVIAAAIASSLGTTIPQINIKSIKRVSSNTTPWADMGRREQVLGKL